MLKNYKPKTGGTRNKRSLVVKSTKSKPEKSLIKPLNGPAGRSNGRISVRHKSRGAKKFYRIIDFKRDKFDIPAKVAAIEYDPNRGPLIALLNYADGEKRYILAPEALEVGATVLSGNISVNQKIFIENNEVGTILIGLPFPFALIKINNDNKKIFLEEKLKTLSGTIKIIIPDWLKFY